MMRINTPFVKITLLVFLIFSFGILIAQEEEIVEEEIMEEETPIVGVERQIISLSELAELMRADEKETVVADYEIISSENDRDLLIDKVFFSLYEIYPGKTTPVKKIYFYNCKFNLQDNSPLVFKNWRIGKLNIIGCEFANPIIFEGFQQYGQNSFLVENCVFQAPLEFLSDLFSVKDLVFRNDTFNLSLLLNLELDKLIVENCRFITDENTTVKDEELSWYQFVLGEGHIENFEMHSNKFESPGLNNVFSLNMCSASLGSVLLQSNYLQSLNLTSAEIEKSLLIDSLFVEDYIGILNFDFPEKNTNVSWRNLAGEKLAIFEKEKSGLIVPYQAKTDKQLADNLNFNDLMSSYNKFNSLYHDRGDIRSANASYVEIKDIETRKQAFEQTVNPSLNNLINYKLNVFLKIFSDYATNPGKSLKQSIWIILLFTILYMLTFSRWDGMNYRYYLSQFNKFSEYVINDDPIEKVFHKKDDELSKEVVTLQKKYIELGKDMPRILKLFGGPLHFLGKFRYDVLPGLIKFFNFQRKKWKNIKGINRVWAGFLIILISMLFSIYVVLVKLFNSLIMSLNSFVVIGFGTLPEEDSSIAMYLSILEGIIGWFLLTIFTITLLSQVLQSA